mgnify:CR=1 FL=1
MTELAEIREELHEFVASAEALERENNQLRSSIGVAKSMWREQAIRHAQTVEEATRRSCMEELSSFGSMKVDHDCAQHDKACLEAFLRSSPQKLALLDFDDGHIAIYNNSSETISMASHVLVFSRSHQYKFQQDVVLPARTSLSLWFGRALKALAHPASHSYHWDFNPPVVPNTLSLALEGVELAKITKIPPQTQVQAPNQVVSKGACKRKRKDSEQGDSKRRRMETEGDSENRANGTQLTVQELKWKQRREAYDPRLMGAWRKHGALLIEEAAWSTHGQGKDKYEVLRVHVKNIGSLPVQIDEEWSLRFASEEVSAPTTLLAGTPHEGGSDSAVLQVVVPNKALGAGSVTLVDATGLARAMARVSQGSRAAPVPKEEEESASGCLVM